MFGQITVGVDIYRNSWYIIDILFYNWNITHYKKIANISII